MAFVQAIRRFVATSWLVAAPLLILFLLIAIPLCLAVTQTIIARAWGAQASEDFFDAVFGAMMWAGELTLVLAPIALAIFGLAWLARWLVRKEAQ